MPLKDPEARRAYMKAYQVKNDHAGKERKRYQDDPARREAQIAYRKAHMGQYAEYQRNSRRLHAREHLLTEAKSRAKHNGIPFTVTIDDVTWPTHCPVLGIELVYVRGAGTGHRTNSASLDRRINALGYVQGNVFVISHRANRLKSDATVAELEAILSYAKGDQHVDLARCSGVSQGMVSSIQGQPEPLDEAINLEEASVGG